MGRPRNRSTARVRLRSAVRPLARGDDAALAAVLVAMRMATRVLQGGLAGCWPRSGAVGIMVESCFLLHEEDPCVAYW